VLRPPDPGEYSHLGRRTIGSVDSHLSVSLGELLFIAIVPTALLAGWLIAIFRATRDYDRRD
jgi:hypothetical protein